MSTPTCHRTLDLAVVDGHLVTKGTPCIGSRCALWVREVERNDGCGVHLEGEVYHAEARVTGRGVCAENRSAVPWPDPLAPPAREAQDADPGSPFEAAYRHMDNIERLAGELAKPLPSFPVPPGDLPEKLRPPFPPEPRKR